MKFEASRAHGHYDESAALLRLIDRRSRRSLWALRAIYQLLVRKIEKGHFAVVRKHISVSKPVKIGLLLAAFLRP